MATDQKIIQSYNTIKATFMDCVDLAHQKNVTDIYNKYFNLPILSDVKEIYRLLAISLQNRGAAAMSHTIKFFQNENIIKQVLFDYDVNLVCEEYTEIDINKTKPLVEKMCIAFYDAGITSYSEKTTVIEITKPNNDKIKVAKNWYNYSLGLIQGALYLNNPTNFTHFINVINAHNLTDEQYIDNINSLPNIKGLGFALKTDWVKNCGLSYMLKPDTHINKVHDAIFGTHENDQEVLLNMMHMLDVIRRNTSDNITLFQLDRMIWLIRTGDFFKDNVKIGKKPLVDLL